MATKTPLGHRFNFDRNPERLAQVRRDTASANCVFDRVRAVLSGHPDDQRLDHELLETKRENEPENP